MKNTQKVLLTTLAAASLVAGLTGCAPLVLGGAAVGALVAVDRRTSGTQLEDETIELRAAARVRDTLGSLTHINVNSYNRQVLITGEVPDAAARQAVEQIVSRVDNVRAVINEVSVMAPTSLTQRSGDALITGKVKARLVDAGDLSVTAFKVVTERGSVYLMGRVTQREAERVTQLARAVSGVTRVVRAFEILSEEELGRISPKAPARATTPAN